MRAVRNAPARTFLPRTPPRTMNDKPTLAQLALIYGEAGARIQLAAPALPAIRAALPAAPAAIVDRPVAEKREIFAATEGLALRAFRTAYLDVPLVKLVALGHKNFAKDAKTWRSLLDGIHGVGWERDTLAYFESEIGTSSFPAPNAAYPLRFQAFGGALICVNGMHRLVAAVCWLAAKDGLDAKLRKVEVRYQPVNPAALAVITAALSAGARVDAARLEGSHTVLLRAHSSDGTRYWEAHGRRVTPTAGPGGWLGNVRRRFREPRLDEAGLKWQPVSAELAAALADTSWLRAQHRAPPYKERPE